MCLIKQRQTMEQERRSLLENEMDEMSRFEELFRDLAWKLQIVHKYLCLLFLPIEDSTIFMLLLNLIKEINASWRLIWGNLWVVKVDWWLSPVHWSLFYCFYRTVDHSNEQLFKWEDSLLSYWSYLLSLQLLRKRGELWEFSEGGVTGNAKKIIKGMSIAKKGKESASLYSQA